MLTYSEADFIQLLKDTFYKEIEQYKLKFKILKLNDLDVLLLIISNHNDKHMNSTVMNTTIKFEQIWNDDHEKYDYTIYVYEDSIEQLFTKIKKTIFDICLVK